MAQTWRDFTNLLRTFWTGADSDDELPSPLIPRKKRKATSSTPARHVSFSKRPRYSFTDEEYQNADFFEGAVERRTSYAGVNTLVQESGTESELEGGPGRRASGYHLINQPRRTSKAPTSAKTASAPTVRQGRLNFFKGLGFNVGTAVDQIREFIDRADEAGLTEEFPALDHALDDLEHARDDVEEVQAQIQDGIVPPSKPIHEYQPTPERNSEAQNEPALPASASVPTSAQSSLRSSRIENEWQTTPNKRARHIARSKNPKAARSKILGETQEPEYVIRDIEIRDMMWQIMDKMERFARKYYDFDFDAVEDVKRKLKQLEGETIKIIGCVASGGPGGEDGWMELFTDAQKRRALICAIIGNVLIEQVFKYACFGADVDVVEELAHVQRELKDEDGFVRTERYASVLRQRLFPNNSSSLVPPPNFHQHVKTIVHAISIHISPLAFNRDDEISNNKNFLNDLYDIVATAGLLSIQMRADPHTVWYFPPIFKEDNFQRKYMECFNRIAMEESHPREPTTIWPPSTTEAEKKRAQNDEPLTQITIMDGITAYRKGGWETADSTVWKPMYGDEGGEKMGIRSRVLVHGWVFCRWGRPRKFVNLKPADDEKIHGVKWKKPGFMEFRDVLVKWGWKEGGEGRKTKQGSVVGRAKSSAPGSAGRRRSGRKSVRSA